jgi:hypothetical protein
MQDVRFPGNLRELEFVDAYCRSSLRKPQMAADAALRALVFSDAADRAILVGLIAQELAESCRRLVAVHNALSDRRYSIARSLIKPLTGAAEWRDFVHQAATFTPEQMCRELSLGEDAIEHAQNLRSQPGLAELTGLVIAVEAGNGMLIVPDMDRRNVPIECWLAGVDDEGTPTAASFGSSEHDAANLADLTADLSSIARGFLEVDLGNRRSAGRRD